MCAVRVELGFGCCWAIFAAGVMGRRGENGEGGMARKDDLNGVGVMVSWRGMMVDLYGFVAPCFQCLRGDKETKTSFVLCRSVMVRFGFGLRWAEVVGRTQSFESTSARSVEQRRSERENVDRECRQRKKTAEQ